jgi:hypothetical protein
VSPQYGYDLDGGFEYHDRMKRPWTTVLIASMVTGALCAAGGVAYGGRMHPATRPVVHVETRTITRTLTSTRTVDVRSPRLLACAEALMGAWETDGPYTPGG